MGENLADSQSFCSAALANMELDALSEEARVGGQLDRWSRDRQSDIAASRAATGPMEDSPLYKSIVAVAAALAATRVSEVPLQDATLSTHSVTQADTARAVNISLRALRANCPAMPTPQSGGASSVMFRFLLCGSRVEFREFDCVDGTVNVDRLRTAFPGLASAYYVKRLPRVNEQTDTNPALKGCYLCFCTLAGMRSAKYAAAARYAKYRIAQSALGGGKLGPPSCLWPLSVDSGGVKGVGTCPVPDYELVDKVVLHGVPFQGDLKKTRSAVCLMLGRRLCLFDLDVLLETRIDVFHTNATRHCTVFLRTFGVRNVNLLVSKLDGVVAEHDGVSSPISATGSSPGTSKCRYCSGVGHREGSLAPARRCLCVFSVVSLWGGWTTWRPQLAPRSFTSALFPGLRTLNISAACTMLTVRLMLPPRCRCKRRWLPAGWRLLSRWRAVWARCATGVV